MGAQALHQRTHPLEDGVRRGRSSRRGRCRGRRRRRRRRRAAASICPAQVLAPGGMTRVEPRLPARVVGAGEIPVGLVSVEAVARRALQVRVVGERRDGRETAVRAVRAEHGHHAHAELARAVAQSRETRRAAEPRLGAVVAVLPVVAPLPAREIGEDAPPGNALGEEAQHLEHLGVAQEHATREVHAVQRCHEAQPRAPSPGRRAPLPGDEPEPQLREGQMLGLERVRRRVAECEDQIRRLRAASRSGSRPPRGSAPRRRGPRAVRRARTRGRQRFGRTRASSTRRPSAFLPARSADERQAAGGSGTRGSRPKLRPRLARHRSQHGELGVEIAHQPA